MQRFLLLLPVLIAACAPAATSSSSPSTPHIVSLGQEWRMTVEGQRGEQQLLVGKLYDHGQIGYDYVADEHMVEARNVWERFYVRNDDEGVPEILTVVRFERELAGPVPRGCSVARPIRVERGESLQGVYIGGEADDRTLSIFLRPQARDLAAGVKCTLTRVK